MKKPNGGRPTGTTKVRAWRQTPEEAEKRARLKAELAELMRRPLTPGVVLSPREKAAIAEKARRGIQAQSFGSKGASGYHAKKEEP